MVRGWGGGLLTTGVGGCMTTKWENVQSVMCDFHKIMTQEQWKIITGILNNR